jgi:ferredoxin
MGYPKKVVKLFLSLWPFTHMVKRLSPYPPFRQVFAPLVRDEIFEVTFIPVAEDIPSPQSTALPRQAIAELIKASSHRFIHDGCICRNQEGCVNYPRELGCIFLGEAASRLHPSLGHRASVEECLEHLEKASETGLVGMVGRIWFDATTLGLLHDFRNFVVVCFCCDCCCLVRADMKVAGPEFKNTLKKLDTVRVEVTDACVGCGTCASTCFVGAARLVDGRAHIDAESCKGCGKCAVVCPNGAIRVEFDSEDALLQELLSRVRTAIKLPGT